MEGTQQTSGTQMQQPQQNNTGSSAPATGNLPSGQTSVLAAPGGDPSAKPPGSEENKVPSLDTFKDIFQNIGAAGPGKAPLINADPAKLAQIANTLDFTRNINPDVLQKAMAGDAKAFLEVLNSVGRQSFVAGTQATSHLVDKQTSAAVDFMQKGLPNQIRSFQSRDLARTENPAFSHPAVEPFLAVIQQQLAQQHPQATALEIASKSREYFAAAVGAFQAGESGKEGASGSKSGSGNGADPNENYLERQARESQSMDWNRYFEG
jgi:hypothetical protein